MVRESTQGLRALVEERRHEIKAVARRHKARTIALFGSVARGDETPGSDLDFLVEFEPLTPAERAGSYLGLLFALEALFNRP
ncbi:MAG TPA: nucleotidyltransferase domain-containing protein, partial [Acidimicrobiia bacterium]|nr:nucleotidyltransferase domain-containing protein [Acidimicrobiia bacterium]